MPARSSYADSTNFLIMILLLFVPARPVVSETKPVDSEILELARKQIEAAQRDEYEAFEAATSLTRLAGSPGQSPSNNE